jgi:uracil-DNA glycosylase
MQTLLKSIRACQICTDLPLGPRPIIQAHKSARLLIIGQAPGTKVHESGIAWNDTSGTRLRDWLGLSEDAFYDEKKVAIMPMGLCYPGRVPKGGDKPPRPECAPAWHEQILENLKNVELTLLVGSYAQNHYLQGTKKKTMSETVKQYQDYLPRGYFPLPHPSWRVVQFIQKNPWFENELLTDLRKNIHLILP